ncbi:hypothetical protein [Bifidobacterium aemilianum]|uniref:hypothetical protein n=1 Tax=Bifidobacterium aemilianum TaxID=2493120 RepID=UPI000FDF5F1C|nr:hypothetical protein [Bifidobacterium aemilianum]
MVKSEPQEILPTIIQSTITVVLLDGVWRRGTTTAYNPALIPGAQYLDYPYDYPYDYAPGSLVSWARNHSLVSSPVRLVVYGPAINPYVMIGVNRYQVDVGVPAGGYLTVDGVGRSIVLTGPDGDRTDCFAAGHRGGGRDRGEYIFQPVPPGSSEVSWPQNFGFDLTVYEERSAPPWI